MKIIVCIKQVPDTTEIKIDPVKGTLIREGVPSIMNPDDKGGLELALRMKEQYGAEVTVITMGPPQADLILREAFAMGADRAILLTDRKFAGADTLATSYALAGAIRTMEYDLIIAGRQAIDGDTAQVGPQIAEYLDLPQITYGIEVVLAGDSVRVKRDSDAGYTITAAKMPCVVTMTQTFYEPRYPSIKSKMAAKKAVIQQLTSADLDVDPVRCGLKGSPTHVKKTFVPVRNKNTQIINEGSAEASTHKLVELLHNATLF